MKDGNKQPTSKEEARKERIEAFRMALAFGLQALNYWESQTTYYRAELNRLELEGQPIKQPNGSDAASGGASAKPARKGASATEHSSDDQEPEPDPNQLSIEDQIKKK